MNLESYRNVQNTAKAVHERLGDFIDSDSTEYSIVEKSVELFSELGVTDTWYHGVLAFVLLGSRSCLSISGTEYQPSKVKAGESNMVTVDLSPVIGGIWGDCARSYFIENGHCTEKPGNLDFQEGKSVERELHRRMKYFVTPNTLFSDLYHFGNQQILELGFENLDFLGNLGHSIETNIANRRFIDENCHEKLGDVELFTFEPHVRKSGGAWGYKHENIYYFDDHDRVTEL